MELTRADGLGWDYYQGLYDNEVMVVNGNGGVINSVAAGENAYGIVCDSNALAAAASGSPLAFVYPEEGVPATADPIGITSTTDNLATAQAFLDFMLSEDVPGSGPRPDRKSPHPQGHGQSRRQSACGGPVNLITDAKVLFEAREQDKEQFSEMFGF